MCFTPTISLTTAIIEFLVATYLLVKYKNYLVPAFSAILIYVLGIYQFTEFMLCTSNNPLLWAKIGFIAYSFLPAIGLNLVLRYTKRKFPSFILYIPAILATLFALFTKNFILHASCSKMFVISKIATILEPTIFLKKLYLIHYFGYVALSILLLVIYIKKEKDIARKYMAYLAAFVAMLTILAPIILIVILPSFGNQFPSIYCEFAILVSIVALVSSEIYSKKRKKEKI